MNQKLPPAPKPHDPFQEFIEKERTRTLLIEATRGGTVTDYWRQVLLVVLFAGAVGGVFFSRTQRFRTVMDTLTAGPGSGKNIGKAKGKGSALAEDPDAAVARAEKMAAPQEIGISPRSGLDDDEEEVNRMQRQRAAIGKQLENFAEGKGPLPTPAAVSAAISGNAPAAPASAGGPGSGTPAPSPVRTPASGSATSQQQNEAAEAPVAFAVMPAGGPSYRQVREVPPQYKKEKTEFPDHP